MPAKGVRGFQKGDKDINRQGRPKADQLVSGVKTKRQKGEDDLHAVLRKLKPLNNIAIAKFAAMLQAEETSEQGRIRIAAFVFKEYQDLIKQLYIEAPDADGEQAEEEDSKPMFSLHVLPTKEDKEEKAD